MNGDGYWLVQADARDLSFLPDGSVNLAVTSPPYWLQRTYDCPGQIGHEPTREAYVAALVGAFREVRRVLNDDGLFVLNLGDGYGGGSRGYRAADAKLAARGMPGRPRGHDKQLLGLPWRTAFALQDDGWLLRRDLIWHITNPMTESVADRPSRSHEYVFMFSKKPRYFYDRLAVAEPAKHVPPGVPAGFAVLRNLRTVLPISTRRLTAAHYAAFPEELPATAIRFGTSEKGHCPACGMGWRRVVERARFPTRPGRDTKVAPKHYGDHASAAAAGWNRPNVVGNRDPKRHVTAYRTLGWRPGCRCGAGEPRPAVVLDNFVGSGTTVLAARRLGRHGIGVDGSRAYLAGIALPRIEAGLRAGPARPRSPRARPAPAQQSLFSDA